MLALQFGKSCKFKWVYAYLIIFGKTIPIQTHKDFLLEKWWEHVCTSTKQFIGHYFNLPIHDSTHFLAKIIKGIHGT